MTLLWTALPARFRNTASTPWTGPYTAGSSPKSCRGTPLRPNCVSSSNPRGFSGAGSRPRPFSTNRASPYGSWAKSRTSTAEKRDTERLRMKAQLDPLTGLYNASSARKRIEASLSTAPQRGHACARGNRCQSFQADQRYMRPSHRGYHALIETARRLGSMSQRRGHRRAHRRRRVHRAFPGRALNGVPLEKRIDELRRGLSFPLPDGLSMSASIGIAAFPDDAADYTGLFRLADASMYADKRHRDEV